MTQAPYLITAIGTPLDADERLCEAGLEQHLADQAQAGIDGILAAGSMGLMQMLRGDTYEALARRCAELWHGKGELLVGVGDASWARTLERIETVCRFPINGVVALAPYLFRFPQREMINYFQALADASPVPLYLYDLPARTGVEIDLSTYEILAKHPNIRGAKVSGRIEIARELVNRFGDRFRVIVAEPKTLDVLLREGLHAHLDGIFAVAPQWVKQIALAAAQRDWERAALFQGKLTEVLELLVGAPSPMGAFTAMMNARGIVGNYHAAPFAGLNPHEREAVIFSPIMRELCLDRPQASAR